tara:strand:- start:134 stop:550 length:417 start_codon:yes stop_codon:yes gene_type:complete
MATTTAAVTLESDLLSDNMSITTDTVCMKAGTTADGLEQMDMGYIEVAIGDQFDLLDSTVLSVNKANKLYVCNESTDETYYITIMIDAQAIGRLYGGDWMFIPWDAEDADADIEIEALVGTNKVSYMWFHEGRTLTSS